MNPSKRHRSMAMRVRSGTPVICMAVAPIEWSKRVPMSSGDNPSLAAPTQQVSALMTEIIFEVLNERSP